MFLHFQHARVIFTFFDTGAISRGGYYQSWAFAVFFYFSPLKNGIFCIFYQINLTGGRLFKEYWSKNRLQGIGLKEIATF